MTQGGGTSEAVYGRLKAALIDGAIEPHVRLDIVRLAENLGVSPTPVREAAMRLLGEGLLETHPRGGTRPVLVSEVRLRSLLELHGRLLLLAVEWISTETVPQIPTVVTGSAADDCRRLFDAIAQAPGNQDLTVIFNHLGDRLAIFRSVEHHVFKDVASELQALRAAIASGSAVRLNRALRSYHRRRIAQAAQLAWLAARETLLPPSV